MPVYLLSGLFGGPNRILSLVPKIILKNLVLVFQNPKSKNLK